MRMEEFIEAVGSSDPAPGGGSVSALCGALSAALSRMVVGLTLGKKKYEDVKGEMEDMLPDLEKLGRELLEAVEKDSRSFEQYMAALSLPKETEEEKAVRFKAMQEGLKAAVIVPLSVAEKSLSILPYAKAVAARGNRTAVTDALVSAMTARTAVLGAVFNVKINLKSIEDEVFVREIYQKATYLEQKAELMEEEIRCLTFGALN